MTLLSYFRDSFSDMVGERKLWDEKISNVISCRETYLKKERGCTALPITKVFLGFITAWRHGDVQEN